MTLEEFKKEVKGKASKHKVRNSWGAYDYYKFYRSHKSRERKTITEHDFYLLIRMINQRIVDAVADGKIVELPYKMGKFSANKTSRKPFIKEGKVIANRAVNWNETLNLWYEDPKAKKSKQLIYSEVNETSKFIWTKGRVKNLSFMTFSPHRSVRMLLNVNNNKGFSKLPYFIKFDTNIRGLYND